MQGAGKKARESKAETLTKSRQLRAIHVPGQWLDVDDAADFSQAGKFL